MDVLLSQDVALLVFAFLAPADLLVVERTCARFRDWGPKDIHWRRAYAAMYPRSHLRPSESASSWRHVYVTKRELLRAWRGGVPRRIASFSAHSDGVNAIAAQKLHGPSSNLYATCAFDRLVKVWRKPTSLKGTEPTSPLMTLAGHQHAVWSLAWSPHPNELFSASFDSTVRCWDVETGQNVRVLEADADRLLSMTIEASTVWTGSLKGELLQWTRATPNAIAHRVQCMTPCISAMAKHGHRLYIGGVKDIEVWDERRLQTPIALLVGHDQAIMDVALLNDDRVITASKDSSLKIWDASGIHRHALFDVPNAHTTAVRSIAVCDDSVATSSNDSTVALWQVGPKTGLRKRETLHVHTKQVPSVDVDERSLYTASCDSSVTIHDLVVAPVA
ncbi:hypothetical protein SPRG_00468 [Saprolegnia parasitica CBS 223.65]|uniref:Uncharacterized protein n=1 Tax=Saprolegnia parasitica (strain CBS 223.65) TaxID=695850 RepID=A0A067CY41_SAPPC|nr:hypothetical protein SPRG_00468 [Saprolegnia parasitica CBS 223.65]KDO35624.1 hypothetical protein SPRG_00468 [Saprolegnia parasitica CBS 223.65]|eukprot:XP_012193952.1 hypothetical protein SPRG_00468 [Saprolegnia parasitica CBS 223.65]